jgi:hypothetical protein
MNRFCFAVCSCFVPVLLVPCLSANTAFAVTYQTVALSGQQAPGMAEGVHLLGYQYGVGPPSINNSGQIFLRWEVSGPGITYGTGGAFWTGTGGALQLCLQEQTQIPGAPPGVMFGMYASGQINDEGTIILNGRTPAPYRTSLWLGKPGNLQPLVVSGDPAPGAPAGWVFRDVPDVPLGMYKLINATGQTAFCVPIGAPDDTAEVDSFWMGSPGNLQLYFKAGDPAPGLPPGSTMIGSAFSTLNASGQAAVHAGFHLPTCEGGTGVWLASGGQMQMVVASGQQVPTRDGATTIGGQNLLADINNAGQIAFDAYGAKSDRYQSMVVVGTPGNVRVVLGNGDPAPDVPGGVITYIAGDSVRINGLGQVAFSAFYDLDALHYSGLWLGDPDSPQLILRGGQTLPSLMGDVTVSTPDHLALNTLGQAAFLTTLYGDSVTDANDLVLGAYDPSVGLMALAREGDLFEVAPGDWRTIAQVNARLGTGTGGQDGLARPLNDLGQVAFSLTFTDNTQGVFIATIPEPASLFCLLATVLLASRQSVVPRH